MVAKFETRIEYGGSLKSHHVLAVVFISNLAIFILMGLCLISSYWITSEGFRQGLLYLCIEEISLGSRQDSLPFDLNKEGLDPGCYPNRDVGYIKICTVFCLVTQLAAIATACLVCVASRCRGLKQANWLRPAICTSLVTIFCDTALLVVYPMEFAKEIDRSNRNIWELSSAFGMACGSAILATGALILLVLLHRKLINSFKPLPASM